MLTKKRREDICTYINKENTVTVQELVTRFDSSEATIRRDLKALEDDERITRVHGGAIKKQGLITEPLLSEKLDRFADEKASIGNYAAQLVNDGDTIFIDAGTTTRQMIAYLPQNIKVVTNSLSIARLLDQRMIETIILGGKIKHQTDAIIGEQAIYQLQQYHFSKAFMGVNAIHKRFGMTTPDSHEAEIKKQAIQQSLEVFHLADGSKFDQVTFAQVNGLDIGTLITTNISDHTVEKYQADLKMKVVET